MNAEQIDKFLDILSNTPTQVILWLVLFVGATWFAKQISEGLKWFRSQLEKYMDRDRDIITNVIAPNYQIQTATRWQQLPDAPRNRSQP